MDNNKGPSTYETKSKKTKNKTKKAKAKKTTKKTSNVGDTTHTINTSNTDNKKDNNTKNNINKKDNDPNKPKERKTINVSIQKRNFNKLNSILNSWDEEGLNISSEVCKCILFKHELENSPLTQTLVSTLNLIKTSLKNKQLSSDSHDEALFTVLKNIISIKIDASELSNFIVDDFYFSNPSSNKDSKKTNDTTAEEHTKDNCNTSDIKQTNNLKDVEDVILTTKEESNNDISSNTTDATKNSTIENIETAITITKEESNNTSLNTDNNSSLENTEIKRDMDNSKKINNIDDNNTTNTMTPESPNKNISSNNNNNEPEFNNASNIIRWDNIPNETIFTKDNQDNETDKIELLNKRLNAFSYPTN